MACALRPLGVVVGHPRPPSVEALVYCGCPCRDPPVCLRVQDDSVTERQPRACGWCVSCHRVSACDSVCKLLLCDGVLHRETVILQTNCDSRVLWHVGILTCSVMDSSYGVQQIPPSLRKHVRWFVTMIQSDFLEKSNRSKILNPNVYQNDMSFTAGSHLIFQFYKCCSN